MSSLKIKITICVILYCFTVQVHCKPAFQEYSDGVVHENRCNLNDRAVIKVCQMCAKQTKSPIVYPMCCSNEEDAFNWCDKYINYGEQGSYR